MILIACLLWIHGSTLLFAQNNFLSSRDAYLGQQPPNDTPKVFAPGMLAAPGAFTDDRIAVSPDGREIFYCTNTTWMNNEQLKIMHVKFEGMKWSSPEMLNQHYNTPTFSVDGKKLFFAGTDGEVWESMHSKEGWTAPSLFLKRNYELYDFTPTLSGNYYAASNGTWGKMADYNAWDISRLSADKSDTTIQTLGPPVNTPGFDGDFYIAPDESYLIISNKETKDFECELAISFRKHDRRWTAPLSLGTLINDGPAHRWGEYVSPDGKYLFYTKGTSEKDCAIYWVRFDNLLKKLKKSVNP